MQRFATIYLITSISCNIISINFSHCAKKLSIDGLKVIQLFMIILVAEIIDFIEKSPLFLCMVLNSEPE